MELGTVLRSTQKLVAFTNSRQGIGEMNRGMEIRQSVIRSLLSAIVWGMATVVCSTGCAPSATVTPMLADPDARALWVWNAEVVTHDNVKAQFLDFIQCEHISAIYLYAYDLLLADPTALEGFIIEAGGAEVELLAGDPSWALTTNHSEVLDFVQEAIVFAQNVSKASRPVGLHFDVEPYLLDEWGSDQVGTITQYLDLLVAIREKLTTTESPLLLSVDIPFWYDTIEATYNGEMKPLHQHVQDIVDYVVIMDYRDTAGGRDGMIAHAQNELVYANKINKLVTVGAETNCIEPAKITFCEEGKAVMERELSEAKLIFEANPAFQGFAIHDYVGYTRLSQPTPTPTPESPIVTPVATTLCSRVSVGSRSPNVIVQGVSYSLNGESPQIASSEEVLIVRPGDTISLLDLQYCSDAAGSSWDKVQGEAYLRKNGAFDYDDGRFTTGAPIQAGEHQPIGAFDGSWTIQPGWDRLVIALVHYYQGGHEVDDRFFVNLVVQ